MFDRLNMKLKTICENPSTSNDVNRMCISSRFSLTHAAKLKYTPQNAERKFMVPQNTTVHYI